MNLIGGIFFFIMSLGAVCGAGVMGREAEKSSIGDRIFLAMSTTCLLMTAIILGNRLMMGA